MKISAENRKQTILAAVVGVIAVVCVIYMVSQFASSPSAPAPTTPVVADAPVVTPGTPGRPAKVVASSSRLDPTLHMEAMLLTESLEYTGNGRNIFSPNSAPLAVIPKAIASARTGAAAVSAPVFTGPPPPPPIDLRFFGVATKADGSRQAFLLRGDDVFLAAQGDIVSRRYQLKSISPNSIEVTDLQNNNTQRLPLTVQ
ncbi:hypothetical protein [Terriglobus saanensis]|uniref:Uncharacterized protein n=1 Tax=Terriglobus saanensis (strain ATCC BAA-1853 / DSM 23119 / SP1PR4) TaxID=401053 RepID=E8V5X6_TERSS|nr:hypothetical protein [Terriglobus saanensis]ADV83794.1 hypothetical protein AciPR4_3035 [Terriglobus saanensis SP1PR4]